MIPKPYIRAALFLLTALILPIVQMTAAQPTCDPNAPILRVSVANGGGQALLGGTSPIKLSGDGRYILFTSSSPDLVTGDTNGFSDVFRYDRLTCSVIRVSVASDGTQANKDTPHYRLDISGDGRFIVFDSLASNLVGDDTNNTIDVFLHDAQTGETRRISVSSSGEQANDRSTVPSISQDGHYIVFYSLASNLVSGDNDGLDIFIYDRITATITRLVIGQSGVVIFATYSFIPISSDGRFIAFESERFDLVPNDTNFNSDVFVYDRQTSAVTRVSVATDGTQGDNRSEPLSITSDGRFVVFRSQSTNLVEGDDNLCLLNPYNCYDIFVHDRLTGETIRASVGTGNIQGNEHSYNASISDDGRIVVFSSNASNLVAGDTNNRGDVFIRDLHMQYTYRISVSASSEEGNGTSTIPDISTDGHFVAFVSVASNLVPEDTNQAGDIFAAAVALAPIGPAGMPQRNYYTSLNVNLSWNRVPLAAGYELEVDDDAGFGSPQNIQFNGEVLAYTVTLPQNGVYYWRVRASDALGFPGNWSVIERFTVNAL